MERYQHTQQKHRLGTLAIHRGLVSRQQLNEALLLQAQHGGQLGDILLNKGWLTKPQLNKVLRLQLRIRLFTKINALLKTPVQSFIVNPWIIKEVIATENFTVETTTQALIEQEILEASNADENEQLVAENYERLLDVVNNNLTANNAPQDSFALETLLSTLIPGTNLSGANIEFSGAEFEPGPRTTINPDGSLDVQLPTRVKQITLLNVKVSGVEGEHLGDVVIQDLQFGADTRVKIYLR